MSRPSFGAVADAVGHSLLVFVFLPALAPVPRWLAFEMQNPLNRSDPVVLTFLPVRGAVLLLNVFWQGLEPGVAAGLLNGMLLAVIASRTFDPTSRTRALALGATTGLVASAAMTALFVATGLTNSAQLTAPTMLLELATGLACGTLTAPTALHLLHRSEAPTATPSPAGR